MQLSPLQQSLFDEHESPLCVQLVDAMHSFELQVRPLQQSLSELQLPFWLLQDEDSAVHVLEESHTSPLQQSPLTSQLLFSAAHPEVHVCPSPV